MWTIYPKYNPFWRFSLPVVAPSDRLDFFTNVTKQLVEIGSTTGIWQARAYSESYLSGTLGGDINSYVDFCRDQARLKGRFWLTTKSISIPEKVDIKVSTKVCYLDQFGTIQAKSVFHLGEVCLPPQDENVEIFSTPPIRLDGDGIGLTYEYPKDYQTHIYITIHSDIWLPWLLNLYTTTDGSKEYYDNRELAFCHTPHFNNF